MTKAQGSTPNKEPSVAQRLIGDFAPKLVELTDDVLFGASGPDPSWPRGIAA
jgi:hypothetical protein